MAVVGDRPHGRPRDDLAPAGPVGPRRYSAGVHPESDELLEHGRRVRPSSATPAPCPGDSSPASHCSQAAISLARSGGGVSNDIAPRVPARSVAGPTTQTLDTSGVEVVITSTPEEVAVIVADAIEALVRRRPAAVLGLATGSSPLPVYDELARRHEQRRLSFAATTAFLLDEYVGLAADHPRVVPRRDRARVHRSRSTSNRHGCTAPTARPPTSPRACAAYEAAIADAGGIDLQLLGVGGDGHIGFNEPGSSLASRTRLKTLTAQTRRRQRPVLRLDRCRAAPRAHPGRRHDPRRPPPRARRHRRGQGRRRRQTVEGPVTAFFPASALQLHPHVSVVVDEAAASNLRLADYYREAYAGKPAWQGSAEQRDARAVATSVCGRRRWPGRRGAGSAADALGVDLARCRRRRQALAPRCCVGEVGAPPDDGEHERRRSSIVNRDGAVDVEHRQGGDDDQHADDDEVEASVQ